MYCLHAKLCLQTYWTPSLWKNPERGGARATIPPTPNTEEWCQRRQLELAQRQVRGQAHVGGAVYFRSAEAVVLKAKLHAEDSVANFPLYWRPELIARTCGAPRSTLDVSTFADNIGNYHYSPAPTSVAARDANDQPQARPLWRTIDLATAARWSRLGPAPRANGSAPPQSGAGRAGVAPQPCV